MKKVMKIAINLVICLLLFAGCGAESAQTTADSLDQASVDTLAPDSGIDEAVTDVDDVVDADDATDAANAEDAEEVREEETETEEKEEKGHFAFQPVVVASIFREIMGEDMCEAYGNYVEAAMNGENEFAVKDADTYDWMIGQFPGVCSPILAEYTESDFGSAYHDGKATFHYTIPKPEFAKREAKFEDLVTGILNETMRDDYSDLEKVLALYEYFCNEYTYDYDTYEEMSERYIDEASAYRFLTTGQGICSECSAAFSYLLLQAGVDATTAGGFSASGEAHGWSYVTINGKNYHMDPTYGMGSGVSLAYFMMTDEQREEEDGYKKDKTCIGCHYKDDQNGDQYDADDDSFAPLWEGYLTFWDHEKNLIYYTDDYGNDGVFDYSSFE